MDSKVFMISGGFDPIHAGHLELINRVRELMGFARLVVVLNTDEWLIRKKGYYFMSWQTRYDTLTRIIGISNIVKAHDSEDHIAQDILDIKPNYFINGGDRDEFNNSKEEIEACKRVGCTRIYGISPQLGSSSEYVQDFTARTTMGKETP